MIASRLPRGRLVRLAVALALTLPPVFSYVAHAVQPRLASVAGQVLFGIYLVLLLVPLAHRVFFRYALPRLRAWPRRARLLWGGVAVGLSLLLLRPLPAAIFPQHHRLEIVALGQRNPAAQASQVWLIELIRADGRRVGFDELERQGTWQLENGWLRAEEAEAALRWSGTLPGGGRLRFVAHPWSGLVRVSWDGQPQVIDLYADPLTSRTVVLPDSGWDDPLNRALRLLALVSDGLSLTMLILLALIWLFDRHNGPPVAAGLLACLGPFYLVFWRQLLGLGAALLLGYLLITGPLYRLVGVAPASSYFAFQILMHQISSVIASGAPLDRQTATFLGQIQPLDSWKRNYDCYTLSPLVYNPEADSRVVNQHPDKLVRVWFRLAIGHIPVLIRHQHCVTSLIWRIDEPPNAATIAGITESAGLARQYGQQTASLLPGLHERLVALHRWSTEPGQIWWIWRPALYLYLLLGTVIALALRWRDRQVLVLGLPALPCSLLWLALITVNDTRFQYAVYLMGLIALVLPFARPLPGLACEQCDAC